MKVGLDMGLIVGKRKMMEMGEGGGDGGDNERPKRLYISLMVGQKRMRGVGGTGGNGY